MIAIAWDPAEHGVAVVFSLYALKSAAIKPDWRRRDAWPRPHDVPKRNPESPIKGKSPMKIAPVMLAALLLLAGAHAGA